MWMLVVNRLKPCSSYISAVVTSVSYAFPTNPLYLCLSNDFQNERHWPTDKNLRLGCDAESLDYRSPTFGRNVAPSSSGAETSKYYLDVSDEGSTFLRTVAYRQSSNTVRRVVKIWILNKTSVEPSNRVQLFGVYNLSIYDGCFSLDDVQKTQYGTKIVPLKEQVEPVGNLTRLRKAAISRPLLWHVLWGLGVTRGLSGWMVANTVVCLS